ncbi:phage tail tape measure protein [Pseudomonas lurida]|uniref:phage tail tape measure protein n=1 Tax=Pseudomonas lurida TaxID=244566 RepID=UPI0017876FDF|nr:phage tail tape measure protein [Pseudomonas lurida]MBD8666540.1 phage tail tape measure protein [Pseudomonas lurida]UZQ74626.1 phage tail tape measure protein [Pseudomonas lurida]
MANNLALGVVIGGAISSTVGAAFKDVEERIKKLSDQGTKARVLQSTIGDTIRLRDEWKKAHDTGSASADGLLKKLETNLRTLKDQGVEVGKLRNEYQKLGQVARGAELKALGHTQIKQGKDGLKSSLGQATALSAAVAIPTKISGDYQAQVRQMSLWAHTAGTEDEGKMAEMVSTIADDKGMSRQLLAKAVGGLIEKGVDWQEASAYAGQIADLIDGQGMEAETIATLINSFKEAGVKKEDMAGMLGQVAAAGDIGAFGPKDMARYLPSMLGNIKRLGIEGPEAVRFLGASLQSQYSQTQDSAAAATNMNNLLNAVISSTSQERFAKEGYDLAGSILAATKSGKAANPVDAFIMLSQEMIKRQDPAKAKKIEALKAKIKAAADGSAEEQQAMVALTEAAGLANIVSDQSASAGLLAQIKYGDKIKADMVTIEKTDGKTKIESDAAKARETSNRRWAEATAGMEASMISLGDGLRPLTDKVADGLGKVGYALADLANKYQPVTAVIAAVAAGAVTLGAALSALKIGKGLLNVGRGSLMGNPNIPQKVIVTNLPAGGLGGLDGGVDGGGKGRRGGKAGGRGFGLPKGAKLPAALAVIEAGYKIKDTYDNATTRDEKAEGYGEAAGGLAGTLAGAAAGAAIGSAVPIIGTVVGGLLGAYLGSLGGDALGGYLGKSFFGGDDGLKKMPDAGPLMMVNAGKDIPPVLGDIATSFAPKGDGSLLMPGAVKTPGPVAGDVVRSLASPPASSTPAGVSLMAVPPKPPAPKIEQKVDISAPIQVTVQGDVKDPAQLARELQPYIAQQQREITQQLESRKLYDDAHL